MRLLLLSPLSLSPQSEQISGQYLILLPIVHLLCGAGWAYRIMRHFPINKISIDPCKLPAGSLQIEMPLYVVLCRVVARAAVAAAVVGNDW